MPFPDDLQGFLNGCRWCYARTFDEGFHHEYLVRKKVGNDPMFSKIVVFLREFGVEGRFFRRKIKYYSSHGMTYWEMGTKSINDTEIINRCPDYATFERRLAEGRLPKRK